jgi:uncharacterized protein
MVRPSGQSSKTAVFVDAVAWIALLNADDGMHDHAVEVKNDLQANRVELLTTEFVLLEVADALAAPNRRQRTVEFIEGLRDLPHLTIIPADSEGFNDGWSLYSQRPDKYWSLTDCISFATMTNLGSADAFTADKHFEQAGFVRLLT